MGYFYIDDSIHDNGEFIIAACIYSEQDLSKDVEEIIRKNGLDPRFFEFKSRSNYSLEKVQVRTDIKGLFQERCRLGLIIIPRAERSNLGIECLKAIKQFIDMDEELQEPMVVYFDQGMFMSIQQAATVGKEVGIPDTVSLMFEQDSKSIRGIQVADMAAHTASVYFKEQLGISKKMVKAGKSSGYDPNMEMELGFEMWATLRYRLFSKRLRPSSGDTLEDAIQEVEPYGLYISSLCTQSLAKQAREAFAEVYLGCIH